MGLNSWRVSTYVAVISTETIVADCVRNLTTKGLASGGSLVISTSISGLTTPISLLFPFRAL